MSRIHLTIDRLSLPEMTSRDRQAFLEALQGELHGILANRETQSAWAKPHRTPVLKLQTRPLESGTSGTSGARTFGVGVARAIGKGLKP